MALQGTLETFSMPEVLRLLAGTKKTGMLALDGDRGVGKVWLREGDIVGVHSDRERSDDVNGVLFHILRFRAGAFVFESDAEPEHVLEPLDVEVALDAAEDVLGEWRELEAVVPSMSMRIRLTPELDAESVSVTQTHWRAIVSVGTGTTARGLGQRMESGELDTCRLIRDLVETGLVDVGDAVPDLEPFPGSESEARHLRRDEPEHVLGDERSLVDHDLSQDEVADLSSNLAGFVARGVDVESTPEATAGDGAVPSWVDAPAGDQDTSDQDTSDQGTGDQDTGVHEAGDGRGGDDGHGAADPTATMNGSGEEGDDEFLAQLTNLSPKAAAAISATAEEATGLPGSDTADLTGDLPSVTSFETTDAADAPEDSDAGPGMDDGPIVGGDDTGDEEINRNLLLKFLSSTKN